MAHFIVILVLISAIGAIFMAFRFLLRNRLNSKWWIAVICTLLIGFGVGVWVGVFSEYQPNADTRIQGFPIPLATFVWEQDRWTDFVLSPFMQYGAIACNVLVAIAFVLVPLLVVAKISRNKAS